MEYLLAALGLCFFIIPFWAYRLGLKDGLALKQGSPTIEPIKTPVEVIQERREIKEQNKQNDLQAQGLFNLLSYDGTPQKRGEDK